MKSGWVGAVLVCAIVASVACSWGEYDGVYTGSDGGDGQPCGGNQGANVVCSDGLTCVSGFCSTSCTSDSTCASGQRCQEQSTNGSSCGGSSCTIATCVTRAQGACDCPGQTCQSCNANGVTESCAFDGQCRATCVVGQTGSNSCLAGQTCIADSSATSCGGPTSGQCTAHCYGSAPHDTPPDAGGK